MRIIDISKREKTTITGDLSMLRIPLGMDNAYVEIAINDTESYFAICCNGSINKSRLENQGIEYDNGSASQWTQIDYTCIDVEFWGSGRVAVFTLNYCHKRDTTSDSGIYESRRPQTCLFFVDTENALDLSLAEAKTLEVGSTVAERDG